MKAWIDSVMEVGVSVIALIFYGTIVAQVLHGCGEDMTMIGNAVVYVLLIGYIIRNSLRGVKKGGKKEKES